MKRRQKKNNDLAVGRAEKKALCHIARASFFSFSFFFFLFFFLSFNFMCFIHFFLSFFEGDCCFVCPFLSLSFKWCCFYVSCIVSVFFSAF